jgi:glycosyltransferase involved in cell wall biosynthesis
LPVHSNALVVIVGDGSDRQRLQERVREGGLGHRVQFLARRSMTAMPPLLDAADALLVHLKKSDLSRLVIPTKTLAYLAACRPILMAMEGAAAELIAEARAGIVLPSGDAPKLAGAIESLRAMSEAERSAMGGRAGAYLSAHFAKDVVIPEYESILQDVARARQR